jgi:hypothetical protein
MLAARSLRATQHARPTPGTPRLQDNHCKQYDANDLSAHASACPPSAGKNALIEAIRRYSK